MRFSRGTSSTNNNKEKYNNTLGKLLKRESDRDRERDGERERERG